MARIDPSIMYVNDDRTLLVLEMRKEQLDVGTTPGDQETW